MAVKKGHIGLLLLLVAALVAVAAVYPGTFSSLSPGAEHVASEPGRRRFTDRIPGVSGQRRMHRIAVDRSGYDGGSDEGFPLNVNLEHVPAEEAPLEEERKHRPFPGVHRVAFRIMISSFNRRSSQSATDSLATLFDSRGRLWNAKLKVNYG